ncbi:alcohol dehydrogenase catalytic domain-containing protein [Virgibacillus pantothenticus]|jgi:L-iditol 2-dehydrogenase|uniref:Sorbitol dehydrogenase n=1 Tax=Virgibacillus pantothenticus TaxID=1473 RepID=A0A0L0QLI8_VIRPA|nr:MULTISPECIES: zinc-binding dehydrogenase [Virgibacillus]API93130.1 sorbitol dehydrogenase [Virgibacillus sp. 6R]KNE19426.1 sorbitol dehydrogenase [Virgibacillus pantothenticus]MBS7428834.1 zinc-binding dehydrogenase [Virgibacillus sp. 19R1-5]MBU8568461.1 zinc-binding dehydrogenase [Virgibacillus pantothenticus]MBU8602458.1 zinc-binding dehydrogenase [Virgibacillus pantothenticus]
MKSLVKTELGFGNLEIQDKKEPIPGKDQVKIKIKYAGICGSDIHTYEGHYKVQVPVTLGHEFSGEVVEVGDNVTEFKVGDRVTSETTFYICGECKYCGSGDYNLCDHRKGLGTHQDGGFAKYLIARKESVHVLPENVDYKSAAMTEPLACTYHAVSKTKINEGDVVVVIGPGPIGLLTAQVAKSFGAKVIITGLTNDKIRLDKAKELGVDIAIDSQKSDVQKVVNKITSGYGADVVFECSGTVPAAKQGLDVLRKKGNYVQVGIFSQPAVPFDLEKVIQHEIHVVGSRSQHSADWEPALALMNEGKVNAKALVTHEFDITQWDEAYQVIKGGEAIKVLLVPAE